MNIHVIKVIFTWKVWLEGGLFIHALFESLLPSNFNYEKEANIIQKTSLRLVNEKECLTLEITLYYFGLDRCV